MKGIIIKRTVKFLDKDGKECKKYEYLRCRVNSAVPRTHNMIAYEVRSL
jgi:hypothetical protein